MHKRRRRAEMAASTIAMLVSPYAMTKGGGPHVCFLKKPFLYIPYLRVEVQNVKASHSNI